MGGIFRAKSIFIFTRRYHFCRGITKKSKQIEKVILCPPTSGLFYYSHSEGPQKGTLLFLYYEFFVVSTKIMLHIGRI